MAPGAKLYVAPMEWNLDRFVVAEVQRQALPVELVHTPEQADFVMTSLYQKLGTHMIAPGHCIQVKIVDIGSGKSVWANEVNDFAIFFGRVRRHGPGRAAEDIIKRLRANLSRSR
jgi:hypothetical protein